MFGALRNAVSSAVWEVTKVETRSCNILWSLNLCLGSVITEITHAGQS